MNKRKLSTPQYNQLQLIIKEIGKFLIDEISLDQVSVDNFTCIYEAYNRAKEILINDEQNNYLIK